MKEFILSIILGVLGGLLFLRIITLIDKIVIFEISEFFIGWFSCIGGCGGLALCNELLNLNQGH